MAKIAGKSVVLKIGGTPAELPAFDFGINESADELDVSDSASQGEREYMVGFISREGSWAYWFRDDATDIPDIGAEIDAELHVGAKKFSGSLVVFTRNFSAKREEATRYDFTGKFNGTMTTGASA